MICKTFHIRSQTQADCELPTAPGPSIPLQRWPHNGKLKGGRRVTCVDHNGCCQARVQCSFMLRPKAFLFYSLSHALSFFHISSRLLDKQLYLIQSIGERYIVRTRLSQHCSTSFSVLISVGGAVTHIWG